MRCLSPRQLAEWIQFYALEPFGDRADDVRTARIAWAAFASQGAKDVTPSDFMPKRDGDEEDNGSVDAMKRLFGVVQ